MSSVWPNIRPSAHYLKNFFRGVLQPPSHCPRHPPMMLQPPPPCRQAHLMRSFFRTIPQSGSPGVVAFETGATPPAIKDRPPGAWVWERATRGGGRGDGGGGRVEGRRPNRLAESSFGGSCHTHLLKHGFPGRGNPETRRRGGGPKKNIRKANRGGKSRS